MIQPKTIAWGPTQIQFYPDQLAETDVQKAASLVSPSFTNLKDSFVGLTKDGAQILSVIPTKPKATLFGVPTQGIGIQEALKQALEKAANFLKGRV